MQNLSLMSPSLIPDTATAFYEIEEVKDVLAYCCVILNPKDEEALLRIINVPNRNIGEETIKELLAFANEHDLSLWDSLTTYEEVNAGEAVREFVRLLSGLRGLIHKMDAYHFLQEVLRATKLLEYYNELDNEGQKSWLNINQLTDRARLFSMNGAKHIVDYLLEIALLTNKNPLLSLESN